MLNNYLNEKNENLLEQLLFLNHFYHFLKIEVLYSFSEGENTYPNISKVLYILEKDDSLDYNLSIHGNLEKISFLPYEKRCTIYAFLFFCYSRNNRNYKRKCKINEIR